jgi:hypothetical protein
METNSATPPATASQQDYADKAAYYAGRAMLCYKHELWPEAANHFGSAMESLLRIRFGSRGRLDDLVKKFDKDDFFNSIIIHDDADQRCVTCYADRARILRNSVHPACWIVATKSDVDGSCMLVLLIYHALIACKGKRIAVFKDSPDPTLKAMEASGYL